MAKIQSVCVYCGASNHAAAIYKQTADRFGQLVATHGLKLVYGGGRVGLMGVVADAVVNGGGEVIGYIPQHLDEYEGGHNGIHELHIVDSMHTRKSKMAENSDAFVILPGGFGTLDELFEILTWRQLGLHHKPIIVMNVNNYWDPLVGLLNNVVDQSFASTSDLRYVQIVTSPEEAAEVLLSTDLGTRDFKAKIA